MVLGFPLGGEAMDERFKWVGLTLAAVFLVLAAFTSLTFDFVATLVSFFPDWLFDRDWIEYPPIPIA